MEIWSFGNLWGWGLTSEEQPKASSPEHFQSWVCQSHSCLSFGSDIGVCQWWTLQKPDLSRRNEAWSEVQFISFLNKAKLNLNLRQTGSSLYPGHLWITFCSCVSTFLPVKYLLKWFWMRIPWSNTCKLPQKETENWCQSGKSSGWAMHCCI